MYTGDINPKLPTVFQDEVSEECVESGFFKNVEEVIEHIKEFSHEWGVDSPTDLRVFNGDLQFKIAIHLEKTND